MSKKRAKLICLGCGEPLKDKWAGCPHCLRPRPAPQRQPAVTAKASLMPAPNFIAKRARAAAAKAARHFQECPRGCGAGIPGTWCQRCLCPLPGEAPSAANGFVGKAAALPCPGGCGPGDPGDRCCVRCGKRLVAAPPPRTVVKSAGEHPLMADYRACHIPEVREGIWKRIQDEMITGKVAGRG